MIRPMIFFVNRARGRWTKLEDNTEASEVKHCRKTNENSFRGSHKKWGSTWYNQKIAVKSELVPQQQAIHQHIILHNDSFDSNSGVPLVSDNEG